MNSSPWTEIQSLQGRLKTIREMLQKAEQGQKIAFATTGSRRARRMYKRAHDSMVQAAINLGSAIKGGVTKGTDVVTKGGKKIATTTIGGIKKAKDWAKTTTQEMADVTSRVGREIGSSDFKHAAETAYKYAKKWVQSFANAYEIAKIVAEIAKLEAEKAVLVASLKVAQAALEGVRAAANVTLDAVKALGGIAGKAFNIQSMAFTGDLLQLGGGRKGHMRVVATILGKKYDRTFDFDVKNPHGSLNAIAAWGAKALFP